MVFIYNSTKIYNNFKKKPFDFLLNTHKPNTYNEFGIDLHIYNFVKNFRVVIRSTEIINNQKIHYLKTRTPQKMLYFFSIGMITRTKKEIAPNKFRTKSLRRERKTPQNITKSLIIIRNKLIKSYSKFPIYVFYHIPQQLSRKFINRHFKASFKTLLTGLNIVQMSIIKIKAHNGCRKKRISSKNKLELSKKLRKVKVLYNKMKEQNLQRAIRLRKQRRN